MASDTDMAGPLITVGMVAFNEARSIARALQSANAAMKLVNEGCELIVALTGCTDETEPEVRRSIACMPNARLICESVRLSKCGALNLVARNARGKIFVFMDADVIIDEQAIRRLVAAFTSETAVAFGRMIPKGGPSYTWTAVGRWTADALHAIRSLPDGSGLWLVCGSIFAVRSDVWRVLPQRLMSDDLYVGLSASGRGLQLRYVPAAAVYGRYPQNLRDYLNQKVRNRLARIQLREYICDEFRAAPVWLGPFAIRRLGWQALPHLPILLIDGFLSCIALLRLRFGNRPAETWRQIQSSKFP